MRSIQTALALAATLTSALASIVQVNNYCPDPHWITVMNGTFFVQGNGTWELPSSWAFQTPLNGKGNSLGVTTTADYWTNSTPKLILGYTTDQGEIWWSVSELDGEPFPDGHFNVTSPAPYSIGSATPDVCGNAVGYEAKNHNCTDAEVTLTLNLCFSLT